MSKILFIANNSAGLYRFRNMLMTELQNMGHEIIASTPLTSFVDEMNEEGIKLIDTPIDRRGINPITDFGLIVKYFKIMRKEKPDLVISYTIKPNIYGGIVCRLLKVPFYPNITGLGTAFQKDGFVSKLVTFLYKLSCKKAKTVFFENSGNRQIFVDKKIAELEKTVVLNGAGVDIDKFNPCEYPTDEKIKFLFIGRVMAEKGINELFGAMEKLNSDNVNCTLEIIGGYEENYKSLMEKHEKDGWLTYSGYLPDVRQKISECSCFVLPSWHEGMANTNLECAASARPVITSNIHGCKEAVEDGVSGFVCEPKNADDLYKVMKEFCELSYEKRKEMGICGRKRMESIFDKRVVVNKTIEALK